MNRFYIMITALTNAYLTPLETQMWESQLTKWGLRFSNVLQFCAYFPSLSLVNKVAPKPFLLWLDALPVYFQFSVKTATLETGWLDIQDSFLLSQIPFNASDLSEFNLLMNCRTSFVFVIILNPEPLNLSASNTSEAWEST